VFGIALASLFSDWSHEMATALLPAFLATIGVAAAWLGIIEGVADGLSSLGKLASGHWTDRLARRKPVMIGGYLITTLATASFGLTTTAWHLLLARSAAWLGRGVRTPVRKAMLAAAVTPATYGRAFGFERMMDTFGAIFGPITAYFLLRATGHNYSHVFFWSLLPGLGAVACVVFFVRERERRAVPHISFGEGLRKLPPNYRKFLVATGLFGAGDCAHTMLILLAAQWIAPVYGAATAASASVALYVLHNIIYSGSALGTGWLADHFSKPRLLAAGYALAAVMALAIITRPFGIWTLIPIFVLAGVFVAVAETAEDSLCADLVSEEQHGMAFGVLATVNGVGDFLSSVIVGLLWSAFGAWAGFSYSLVLFCAGAILIWRVRDSTPKPSAAKSPA
jgi:MFS family permease